MLFRHDDLDDQKMPDDQAGRGFHIANRIDAWTNGRREFELDLSTADGLEVGFPALLQAIAADVAHLLVLLAFSFAANFVPVLGASGGDVFAVLIDAPVQLLYPPAGLCRLLFLNDAVHAKLDEEGTDWVDDWGMDDVDGEVCGGKDANRLLLWRWLESALDADRVLVSYDIGKGGDCSDLEGIVNAGQDAMCGGG